MVIVERHISDEVGCGRNGRLKLAQAIGLGSGRRFRLEFRLTQLCRIILCRSSLVVLIVCELARAVLVSILSYCGLVRLPGY